MVLRYCDDFGRGLAGLIALLDLDCVVLGGGVSMAGNTLFLPLRRAIARHMPPFLPRSGVACPPPWDRTTCSAAPLSSRCDILRTTDLRLETWDLRPQTEVLGL